MSAGSLLVRNASQVVTCEGDGPADLGVIDRGAVLLRGGKVWWVGPEADLPTALGDIEELDAGGGCVLPGFVDAHTHLAFAGDRAAEHQARLAGDRYQTGGIMTTVAATRAASTEALVSETEARAWAALSSGTTTLEAKSGYGLDTDTERRLLEVLATVGERTPLRIVPTFLGAHLLPEPGYLDLLVEEMLPACAPLAEGCDAFCDLGALSVEEARKALEAGMAHGLTPRLHAEELAHTGGALLAAELGCASADHLVHANDDDARALAGAGVVAVLLPATSFCLRSSYAPAERFLGRGVTIALATDCNPGTSYTTSMPFVIAVACSELRLSAEEAVRAATAGGAAALRRPELGRLAVGNPGDLVVLAGESYVDLAYHPGMDRIVVVVAGGEIVKGTGSGVSGGVTRRDNPGFRGCPPERPAGLRRGRPVRPPDPLWPTAAAWLGRARDSAAPAPERPAEPELAVVGLPLSVTSITQPAGAHQTPEAIRRRLAFLSTYHSERDVDVGELAAVDFGDLDPQPSNKEIASAARDVVREAPMAILLGGDNAVTYPAMAGMAGEGIEGWGLVTLDAHHDVRTYEGRPGNGSAVRALIDAGLPGNQVVQVGIAGFSNSVAYRRWCDDEGIDVVTAAEVRFGSLEDVLVEAFDRLALSVDHIYVDLDVDVLDSAFAPACPGARPGGLSPGELLAAAFLAGRNPRVRAVDIVEVDAARDVASRTVDVAALCLLNAAAGLHERLR